MDRSIEVTEVIIKRRTRKWVIPANTLEAQLREQLGLTGLSVKFSWNCYRDTDELNTVEITCVEEDYSG